MIAKSLKKFAVDIAGLKFDPNNSRAHSKKNLAAIRESLKRLGQQKPIVVMANGTIIAGNGTVAAAKELGWTQVAAVVFEGTKKQAAAFALADNRTAELAEWDFKELAKQLKGAGDFLIGFDETEAMAIMRKAGAALPPGAPVHEAPTASRLQHTCPSCGHKFSSPRKGAGNGI